MIPITKSNCNYHLSRLYKERDRISEGISRAEAANRRDTVIKLAKEYSEKCDLIDQFLKFRRENQDCLLEGDPGYGPL